MNVAKVLEAQAQKYADRPAFIFKDEPISFRQLKDFAFYLASSLLELGIKKGDKVAIYLPNCPEYVYSYLAIWSVGATAVPLDFMLTEEELLSCISHAGAKLLIAKSKAGISFERLKDAISSLENIVFCQDETGGFLSFRGLLNKGQNKLPDIQTQDKDQAIIFYTSGTTGKPKGVLVNYQQLDAPPKALRYFVKEFVFEDIGICALSLSHLAGLIYLQFSVELGTTFVLMERFSPLEFLRNVQDHKVTFFWLVPSMYYAILQLKEFENVDLTSVRWLTIFGAPSSPEAIRRFHRYCPNGTLYHGWGMTETNAPTCVIPSGSNKIESVGLPTPWIEMKIFDEADKEVSQDQIGEIVVRGWVVTDGYYKDPEGTRLAMRSGWFHTGDLGRIDAEGYFYIAGRKKEMIKVAGEIVFEPEVEAAIHKNPEVAEVAVIGVADKLRGEVPKAFVVLKEKNKINDDELRYFCRQHLAHFKIPHYFEFVDTLPKNRTGKIDKSKLRNEAKVA